MQSVLEVASRLGILAVSDFLEDAARESLLAGVRAAPSEPAPLYRASADGSHVERPGTSRRLEMPAASVHAIASPIADLMPRVADHFGLDLSDHTAPSFLTYREGHHVPPHPDTRPEAEDEIVRNRKVTTVTFLSDTYEGGELVLYGLMGPGTERHGLPIRGPAGTLVAFRADVLHEVRPVTHGERHTVVSWYL